MITANCADIFLPVIFVLLQESETWKVCRIRCPDTSKHHGKASRIFPHAAAMQDFDLFTPGFVQLETPQLDLFGKHRRK